MFDTELLQAFVGVAEGGGFTRAAERLNLTQSAVSAQIKRLEAQAGCALLVRSTRSVALTPHGEILLEYARSILALHEDVRVRLGSSARIDGALRIGLSEGYLGGWLADTLQRFKALHPAIDLALNIGITASLLDDLNAGHLDIVLGVTCGPGDATEVLWSDPLVWAFSDSIVIDRHKPLPLCLFPEPCPYRAAALSALGTSPARWRISCVSASAASVRAVAQLGFGITPLLRGELVSGIRDVGKELGLPPLPTASLAIWISPQARTAVVHPLIQAIHQGFDRSR